MSRATVLIVSLGLWNAPPTGETAAHARYKSHEGASLERVGDVNISSMVCRPFGYSIGRAGLAEWTTG